MAIYLIGVVILLAFSTAIFLGDLRNKNKKLPPSPKGIPMLGHLHMLGKNPHQDLRRIAQKYGPIMHMKFGFVPNIIVSSPHSAQQFLKTHDLVFASRPPHQAAKYLSYGQKNLSFGEYGPYWRHMRKVCTLELLSAVKINAFRPMRHEEMRRLINSLQMAARERAAVDLSARVLSLTTEMSCRMVFGRKYEDKDIDERGFKVVIQEGMKLTALPNLGDYFPLLGSLDLQVFTRRMKALAKVFDDFFEKIIANHVKAAKDDGQAKDIVDTLISIMQSSDEAEFQFDREHVKAIMLDMLVASMDIAASAVEWTLSELLKHPREMNKVQKELEQTVGLNRMVEESDLDNLHYLDMVIKETFRLHPVAPLLIPHYSMQECNVEGYHIPKGSRIIINAYALGRDPGTWGNDPDDFAPERFVGSNVDLRGQHFELIPFGSGRRGCPGMQLGLLTVKLIVAQLVHCFDWQLPNDILPSELDMSEEFGLVVARAKHLVAIPTYRLHK